MSKLILGGDRLSARKYRVLTDKARRHRLLRVLDSAYEFGINAFDTARVYPGSEKTLGAWIKQRGNRDSVVLITKIGHPGKDRCGRLTPRELRSDLRKSLRAFKTDKVDVLLLHHDDPSQDVGPIMRQLNQFVADGMTDAIGASNWDYKRVALANEYAAENNLQGFSAASAHFGLLGWVRTPWPNAKHYSEPGHLGAVEFLSSTQLPLLVWSSLSFGYYSREYDPKNTDPRSRWISRVFGSNENHNRRKRVKEVSERLGRSQAQVALAYALAQNFPTHCIVGCHSREHLQDCVNALDIDLDEKTMDFLRP